MLVGIDDKQSIITGGLTYGVGPDRDGFFGRTEIGVEYDIKSLTGIPSRVKNRINFNVKTQLYNNDRNGIRLVIGGTQLGDNATFGNIGYITGSKNFGKPGRLHLGLVYVSNDFNRINPPSKTSVQLAYEYFFTPKLHGIVEFNNDKTGYIGRQALGQTALSLIYYLDDRSDVQVAVARPNRDNLRNAIGSTNFYVAYDYNFGRRPAAPEAATSEGEARK